MPYKSAKQLRYMHARHPDIAKRWDREYGSTGKLPLYSRKKRLLKRKR